MAVRQAGRPQRLLAAPWLLSRGLLLLRCLWTALQLRRLPVLLLLLLLTTRLLPVARSMLLPAMWRAPVAAAVRAWSAPRAVRTPERPIVLPQGWNKGLSQQEKRSRLPQQSKAHPPPAASASNSSQFDTPGASSSQPAAPSSSTALERRAAPGPAISGEPLGVWAVDEWWDRGIVWKCRRCSQKEYGQRSAASKDCLGFEPWLLLQAERSSTQC